MLFFSYLSLAYDQEPSQGCILLLGPCIHCPSWWAEKNFYAEETSLGACRKELCIERTTLLSWTVIPKAKKEKEERWKAKGAVEKEEVCEVCA